MKQRKAMSRPVMWIGCVILIGLVLNIVVYAYAIAPQQEAVKRVNGELERLQLEWQTMQAEPIREPITAEDVERLVRQVPVRGEQSRLMMALREMEREAGITLKMVDFHPEVQTLPGSELISRSLRLQLQGMYAGVKDFVQLIHEQERLIQVNNWRLQTPYREANSSSTAYVELDLSLQVYLAPSYASALGDVAS